MDYKELVGHCVYALDTFDSKGRAVEDHINQYLKYQIDLKDDDQLFIVEVFSGCIRYTNVLQVVMVSFYNKDGKTCLRSEENLYRVIAYLALFRLDELSFSHFRKFVKAQDNNKMYRFLNFFLSDKNLRTWIKDEWSKQYDASFVQTNLLSPILRWMPEIDEFLKQMKNKLDANVKIKKPELPLTVGLQAMSSKETKPFKLSQPRARSIPIPEPIPTLQRHNPVPKATFRGPTEFDVMAKIKETNRRKAEERLMEASKIQFACANPEKSDKTKGIINNIIQEQNDRLDFEKQKSNPPPMEILTDNVPCKLNTAAILREKILYKQREAKEIKKLEKLEAGSFNDTQFNQWQYKMKTMDDKEKLAEIERRRIDGQLTMEQAILARHNVTEENKKKAVSMREEASLLMEEFMKSQLRDEERRKDMVQKVLDTHENAKEAKIKVQQFKAKIVQQVVGKSKELMRKALEEAEQEMKEKMVLIRQIRAMESVPVRKNKLLDLGSTAGYGFLSEMSITELNERITLLRIQQNEDEEERRDQILSLKQAKDESLMDALATISRHRTENSKAAAIRFETRKKTRNWKPEITDEKVLDMQRQLEEKRALRMRQQRESKVGPTKYSAHRLRQLNDDKKTLEQSRWRELELTREKTARVASCDQSESTSRSMLVS